MFLTLVAALALTGNGTPQAPAADVLPRRGSLGVGFTQLAAEERTRLGLQAGIGLVALAPVKGLTAEKAGVQAGDILVEINGVTVRPGVVQEVVRTTASNSPVRLKILRGGKPMELTAPLSERPRDRGTKDYRVDYEHVVAHGNQRMRTLVTVPKKPGKHPGFLFIQGFSPVSYDYTLEGAKGDVTTIDGPILHDFAKSGYVTVRVEKPGVGDSEGGPFAQLDYWGEIDIYRQALKRLKSHPDVDPDRVFIFGHSMGGSFGPMIAAEIPVRGIAVYGTAARTWHEYLLDTMRYQSLLGGAKFEDVDEELRQGSRLISLVFHEGKSIAEVKKSHPQLAQIADQMMPGGLFNGKTLAFWKQLGEINFPKYWAKVNTHVLAVKGNSDFVVYEADHKLIADAVNQANPGYGKFVVAPNMDHLFHRFKTEQDSMRNWQRGEFNNDFSKLMKDWIAEVLKVPAKR